MAKFFVADRQIDKTEDGTKLINPYCLEDCHESARCAFHEGCAYPIEELEAFGGKYVGGESQFMNAEMQDVMVSGKMFFNKSRLDDPTRETYMKARAVIEAKRLLADADEELARRKEEAARIVAEAEAQLAVANDVADKADSDSTDEDKKVAAKAAKAAKDK